MCHCCYHPTSHLTSMKKTKPPPKTSLKTRSSNRRPKFLSLPRQLSPENCPPMTPNPSENELHLFPLHPENLFGQFSREPEDKEIDENVAWFLDPEGSLSEGGTTINGLLGTSDEDLEPSMVYNYIGPEASRSNVAVAAALRHKARHGDEKWVVYSDVAAVAAVTENEEIKSKAEEEVSSAHFALTQPTKLSLKLDYEDILNAWSDKGPLYIEGERPQTVPDQDDRTNVFVDVGCARNVKLWSVPEDGCSAIEDGEGKMGQREARVMRYKEKRQSRLFSKRIRYEVRKLNAEKRPRMKGRFVKRKADV